MDFGRAFSYVTEDSEWFKKVGIAALVLLIPVIGPFVLAGWALEITRRVINDELQPLPAWDNFGEYLINGLKETVISIVYLLPAILVYGCGVGTFAGLTAAAGNMDGSTQETLATVAMGSMFCMYCFLFLFIIIGMLLLPPAIGTFAATGQLGAAFRFGEIFGLLRAAIGPYIISLIILSLAASVLTSIGSIACGVGALFAAAYIRAVSGHMYGQAYKIAKGGALPAPVESTM
jgi:hypothetical protein